MASKSGVFFPIQSSLNRPAPVPYFDQLTNAQNLLGVSLVSQVPNILNKDVSNTGSGLILTPPTGEVINNDESFKMPEYKTYDESFVTPNIDLVSKGFVAPDMALQDEGFSTPEISDDLNINNAIRYDFDDTKGLFKDENIPDNLKSGIIYEYDWYTKAKKWHGDKGKLWHGLEVDKDKQAELEDKVREKIIAREIAIDEGKTYPEKSNIKMQLDSADLNDLNKVRLEQGLEPIKENTTFVDPVDGKTKTAKFVVGTLPSPIDGLPDEINLYPHEIKRLSYILSDGIRSSHKRFDGNTNTLGLIDPSNDKLTLGMNMNLLEPYSVKEMETLSHELGHLIHFQLAKNTIPEFIKDTGIELGVITKEMAEVSKKMRPELWDDERYSTAGLNPDSPEGEKEIDRINELHAETVSYRMKDVELMADLIKGYLTNPKLTKELAPESSKLLKNLVNKSWFNHILLLSKADILPPNNIDNGLLSTATV